MSVGDRILLGWRSVFPLKETAEIYRGTICTCYHVNVLDLEINMAGHDAVLFSGDLYGPGTSTQSYGCVQVSPHYGYSFLKCLQHPESSLL